MDERNVASLEASQRLVKAGIVLETDLIWLQSNEIEEWTLSFSINEGLHDTAIPAPSMAEAWRELPNGAHAYKCLNGETESYIREQVNSNKSANPTDALIDLLIWATEQRKEKV